MSHKSAVHRSLFCNITDEMQQSYSTNLHVVGQQRLLLWELENIKENCLFHLKDVWKINKKIRKLRVKTFISHINALIISVLSKFMLVHNDFVSKHFSTNTTLN